MEKNNKKIGIEALRVVAMICVVFLHTAAQALRTDLYCVKWDIINIISSFATASVPVFFMISGALILGSEKTYSVGYTLKKRLPRLLMPTIFWTLIAVINEYYFIWYYKGVIDIEGAVKKFLTFPQGYVMVHFWFMYFLIPMYLISPALKVLIDKCPKDIMKYLGWLWLINLMSFTLKPIMPVDIQPFFDCAFVKNIGFINNYLGYFVLGYYLYTGNFKITNRQLEAIIVITAGISAAVTAYVTRRDAAYSEWFKSYINVDVLILSSAIFIRGIRINSLPKVIEWVIFKLSPLTFGVYLAHNIYISALNYLKVPKISAAELLNVFFQTLIVCIVIVQMIEWIKRIIKAVSEKLV